MGSGCGSVVGTAVASDIRDPRFESSHRQFYLFDVNCIKNGNWKDKKSRGKSPGWPPFLNCKKILSHLVNSFVCGRSDLGITRLVVVLNRKKEPLKIVEWCEQSF